LYAGLVEVHPSRLEIPDEVSQIVEVVVSLPVAGARGEEIIAYSQVELEAA